MFLFVVIIKNWDLYNNNNVWIKFLIFFVDINSFLFTYTYSANASKLLFHISARVFFETIEYRIYIKLLSFEMVLKFYTLKKTLNMTIIFVISISNLL